VSPTGAPLTQDESSRAPVALPAPYERVIGRYALCAPFARGGMATVHLARQISDEGFSRVVAVKRLHAHVAESKESLAMFLDEARLASRIRHSNVVPTLDVVSRDGELLIVMEYILGQSLSSLLRACQESGERMPVPIATRIAIDTLRGLHAAHVALDEEGKPLGIVHRDVSPQNILVGVDGVCRIVDFGIAKAVGRLQTTQNNKLKGKLAYMAPEQLERTRGLDGRVDLYAASIVLWEMLAARRLFKGEDEVDTFKKALGAVVPPLLEEVPDLDPRLAELAARGLARDREGRPETARAMAEELEATGLAASAAQLADWVKTVAQRELDSASSLVSALERAPSLTPDALKSIGLTSTWSESSVRQMVRASIENSEAETAQMGGEQATQTVGMPEGDSKQSRAGEKRRAVPLVAAGLLLLALGGLAWGFSSPHGETIESAASLGEPGRTATEKGEEIPRDASESKPSEEERAPENEPEPESGSEASEPVNAPVAAPPKKAASPPVNRVTRPMKKRVARPKPSPKDDCANPFTVDKDGVRVPKVHCL